MASIKSLQIKNDGEVVEKREPSYTVGRNVNWYSHYGEQYGSSLKKQEESHHMTLKSYLGKYPEKTIFQRDTCIPTFISSLLDMDTT